MKTLLAAAIAAALTTMPAVDGGRAVGASQDKKADKGGPSVAGQWTINVKSPHGDVAMVLDLAQEGEKVTGMLATPHGDDLPVEGEFVAGTLTLATAGSSETRVSMTAKLQATGTLDGYLSSQMGDMTWTARRTATK